MVIFLNRSYLISQTNANKECPFLVQILSGFQSHQASHKARFWDNCSFLIHVIDLPLSVKDTIVALFAEDCKCLKNIHNRQSCIELQNAIDSLFEWSQKWRMDFNISKCYIISFNRSINSIVFNYTMDEVPLKRVNTVCGLGITNTNSLSWNKHIESIISKASRMSDLVKSTLGWHSSTHTKYIMYCSCIVH